MFFFAIAALSILRAGYNENWKRQWRILPPIAGSMCVAAFARHVSERASPGDQPPGEIRTTIRRNAGRKTVPSAL